MSFINEESRPHSDRTTTVLSNGDHDMDLLVLKRISRTEMQLNNLLEQKQVYAGNELVQQKINIAIEEKTKLLKLLINVYDVTEFSDFQYLDYHPDKSLDQYLDKSLDQYLDDYENEDIFSISFSIDMDNKIVYALSTFVTNFVELLKTFVLLSFRVANLSFVAIIFFLNLVRDYLLYLTDIFYQLPDHQLDDQHDDLDYSSIIKSRDGSNDDKSNDVNINVFVKSEKGSTVNIGDINIMNKKSNT